MNKRTDTSRMGAAGGGLGDVSVSADTGSAAQKHRIVQAWHGPLTGRLWVLGSDGRMFMKPEDRGWLEIESYPPGLEP